jgi:hypothetical protein
MKPAAPPVVTHLGDIWKSSAGLGGVIAGALSAWIIVPPLAIGPSVPPAAAQFVAILVVAFLVVPATLYGSGVRAVRTWYVSAVATLILSLAIAALYFSVEGAWTADPLRGKVVIGSTMLPVAQAYHDSQARMGRNLGPAGMIDDNGGNVDKVFDPAQTRQRSLILLGLYLLCVACFTTCVASILQAASVAQRQVSAPSTAGGGGAP